MTLTVRMWVVPIQAGRLLQPDSDGVVQRLAGHGDHVEHVVLRSLRRDIQPVKMHIRHVHSRADGARLARYRR